MDKKWKHTFQMWSATDEYKSKVEQANRIIRDCFSRFNHPYLAYSGGKDSMAMLHLVLNIRPDTDVWLWNHGPYLMPRILQNEIEKNAITVGTKNLIVETSSALKNEKARWDYNTWYRSFFGILNRYIKNRKWDCVFLGIRRQESCSRNVRAKESFNYKMGGIPQCYPLKDWSWLDVYAYIVSNHLPLLSYYDKYATLQGYENVRLCTFFDQEFDDIGGSYVHGVLMPEFRNERPQE